MFSRRVDAAFVVGTGSTVFAARTRRLNGHCFDAAHCVTETTWPKALLYGGNVLYRCYFSVTSTILSLAGLSALSTGL